MFGFITWSKVASPKSLVTGALLSVVSPDTTAHQSNSSTSLGLALLLAHLLSLLFLISMCKRMFNLR